MMVLVWASGHWHLFENESGAIIEKGNHFYDDEPLKDYPDAQLYLAVPAFQCKEVKVQ